MNVSRPGTPIFGYYPKSHGPDLASMQLFRSSMGSDVTSAGSDGGKDGKGSSTLIRLDWSASRGIQRYHILIFHVNLLATIYRRVSYII